MNQLIQKSSRPLVILLAAVVVIITSMVVANATQTITTPNAVNITYSLAVGTGSAVITVPSNRSVLVMGCCTTPADSGTGQVTLSHPSSGSMSWVGLESTPNAAIAQGTTALNGVHVVYIDFGHQVDIQTASASTILVENNSAATRAGNVTLIW